MAKVTNSQYLAGLRSGLVGDSLSPSSSNLFGGLEFWGIAQPGISGNYFGSPGTYPQMYGTYPPFNGNAVGVIAHQTFGPSAGASDPDQRVHSDGLIRTITSETNRHLLTDYPGRLVLLTSSIALVDNESRDYNPWDALGISWAFDDYHQTLYGLYLGGGYFVDFGIRFIRDGNTGFGYEKYSGRQFIAVVSHATLTTYPADLTGWGIAAALVSREVTQTIHFATDSTESFYNGYNGPNWVPRANFMQSLWTSADSFGSHVVFAHGDKVFSLDWDGDSLSHRATTTVPGPEQTFDLGWRSAYRVSAGADTFGVMALWEEEYTDLTPTPSETQIQSKNLVYHPETSPPGYIAVTNTDYDDQLADMEAYAASAQQGALGVNFVVYDWNCNALDSTSILRVNTYPVVLTEAEHVNFTQAGNGVVGVDYQAAHFGQVGHFVETDYVNTSPLPTISTSDFFQGVPKMPMSRYDALNNRFRISGGVMRVQLVGATLLIFDVADRHLTVGATGGLVDQAGDIAIFGFPETQAAYFHPGFGMGVLDGDTYYSTYDIPDLDDTTSLQLQMLVLDGELNTKATVVTGNASNLKVAQFYAGGGGGGLSTGAVNSSSVAKRSRAINRY